MVFHDDNKKGTIKAPKGIENNIDNKWKTNIY